MTFNWQLVAHGIIGATITACQAIAMAYPDPKSVNICHIITLVVINLGITFGVWQRTQLMGALRDNAALTNRLALPEFPLKGAEHSMKVTEVQEKVGTTA